MIVGLMSRTDTVCPKCGTQKVPTKEKINGQDTQDFICRDCGHIGWWRSFHPEVKEED